MSRGIPNADPRATEITDNSVPRYPTSRRTVSDANNPGNDRETVASMVSYPHYLALLPREENELVVLLDTQRRVTKWDDRAVQLLGFTKQEVEGKAFDSLLTKRNQQIDQFKQSLDTVVETDSPLRFEVEHRTANSGPLLLRGVVTVVRQDDGEFGGWLLVMHRAVEDHCLDCRLLFYMEAITADSADAIIVLDENERIQSWNRGAHDIYGFTPEEVVGRPVEILFPKTLLAAGELDHLRRIIREQGFIRSYETTRMTRDGRTIPVELTRSAIRDSRGRLIGSSAIVRDITLRKRLEERLLHTERLAVVGRMAAQVAHELRNPLSAISLNAELLADELSALPSERIDEARSLLDSMTREIDRLAAVSEEYLQFARLPEFDPAPTDVVMLVEDLAEFTEIEMSRAGIKIVVENAQIPTVGVDRKQLRQALFNLIRNGLQAMSDGGTLTLSSELQDDGENIELSVADTGPGVTDEAIEHIYEPFFSTKDGGTGLGLAIARRIAHEHGGDLLHRPTPGGGATFTMRLPVKGTQST
jgi:PAS domain S-box-containing protein